MTRIALFTQDAYGLGHLRRSVHILAALSGKAPDAAGVPAALVLRDILDPPDKVRAAWRRDGTHAAVERYFAHPRVRIAGRLRSGKRIRVFPGAVPTRPLLRLRGGCCAAPSQDRQDPGRVRRPGTIRAGLRGGGADGYPLLRSFTEAALRLRGARSLVVTGELMPEQDRRDIAALAAQSANVRTAAFLPDLSDHIAAADLVVAMAGYNTTAEIVAMGAPAVLVPRTWRPGEHAGQDPDRVDGEQLHRAHLLSQAGHVRHLHPKDLTPDALLAAIKEQLERPTRRRLPASAAAGAAAVADELAGILTGSRPHHTG